MSTTMSTPEQSTADSPANAASIPSSTAKPQRVLACAQCHQRKVRCDRKFPCANCVKSHAKCIPAATLAPRPRRRRFPERELLDHLRYYEGLLRKNNITFESLHEKASRLTPGKRPRHSDDGEKDHDQSEQSEAAIPSSTMANSETASKPKYALIIRKGVLQDD